MSTNQLKNKAQKLRDSGYSYNMINEKLGITKSTLSNWFSNRPFVPNKEVLRRVQYGPIKSAQIKHDKKIADIKNMGEIGIKEVGVMSKRDLWFLGLGLYIGEGNKSYDLTRIINSNPRVVKLAVKWLKEALSLTNDNLTVLLHLYPDNNIKECLKFWSKTTGLPLSNFRKTHIDVRIGKSKLKKNKLPYGTAHISIASRGDKEKGVKLSRRVMGWIEGVLLQV